MFKIIWFCLLGCLIIGILFMGNVILDSVSDTSKEMKQVQSQVKAKAQRLKEDVINKKETTEEMLKRMGSSLIAQKKPSAVEAESGDKIVQSEKSKPKLDINPVDEEDRRLTAEILQKGAGDQKGLKENMEKTEGSKVRIADNYPSQAKGEEASETMDLDRMASIREIYRQALETLDFK